jgi:membrane associated rhomboid family serine protease
MTVQGSNDENGDSENKNDHESNIIQMPPSGRRHEGRVKVTIIQGRPAGQTAHPGHPPLINLPPFTRIMVFSILLIEIAMKFVFDPVQQYWIMTHFGFTPAYYTGVIPFDWPAIVGPFSHPFLHGGWTHVFMNGAMLMAFGAGLERWMGWKNLGLFMLCCSLAAAAIHLTFNLDSSNPVIGASGAISGMFAAAMVMLKETNRYSPGGNYGFMPFIIVWIGISVLFGVIGGPNGENIAWIAHIGGFLAGFALIRVFKPR